MSHVLPSISTPRRETRPRHIDGIRVKVKYSPDNKMQTMASLPVVSVFKSRRSGCMEAVGAGRKTVGQSCARGIQSHRVDIAGNTLSALQFIIKGHSRQSSQATQRSENVGADKDNLQVTANLLQSANSRRSTRSSTLFPILQVYSHRFSSDPSLMRPLTRL
jgi:hypothetical protein